MSSEPDWENGEPFIIESPTRIRLGPAAKHWAREYGLTDREFAKYLLDKQRDEVVGQTEEQEDAAQYPDDQRANVESPFK
jgi:hypothetical protein